MTQAEVVAIAIVGKISPVAKQAVQRCQEATAAGQAYAPLDALAYLALVAVDAVCDALLAAKEGNRK